MASASLQGRIYGVPSPEEPKPNGGGGQRAATSRRWIVVSANSVRQ
jgi:hypothetical protein